MIKEKSDILIYTNESKYEYYMMMEDDMKRVLIILILIIGFCYFGSISLALTMPSNIKEIKEEAFNGDRNLEGVLYLPSGIKKVGKDAFSGTNLFALHIPEGTETFGKQEFIKAAYVYVNDIKTEIGRLENVQYIIAPKGSYAESVAISMGLHFVEISTIVEYDGFYYQDVGKNLMLLSAKDSNTVGSFVLIPEVINGKMVTKVSSFAFIGCTKLTTISLPRATENTFSSSAKEDCLHASITFYGDALASPTIYGKSSYLAGEDLIFSIDPVEGATNYVCRIYYDDTWRGSTVDENYRITFEATGHFYNFHARDDYRLVVTAYGEDEAISTAEFPFVITGMRPIAPIVTVNKSNVNPQEEFTFTINSPGGELLAWYAYEDEPFSGNGSYEIGLPVIDDITLITDEKFEDGDYYYTFSLLKEGQWSAWSEPVLIHVENKLPLPTLIVPERNSLGNDVSVVIEPVEGANQYDIILYNAYGVEVSWKTLHNTEGGEVIFEGYLFNSATYTIKASVCVGNSWSNYAEAVFTVIDTSRPNAPIATVEKNTVFAKTDYCFTITSTDATKVVVRSYCSSATFDVSYKILNMTGDILYWSDKKNVAGVTWNYAFAVQVDGVWSPWSTTQRVSIVNE